MVHGPLHVLGLAKMSLYRTRIGSKLRDLLIIQARFAQPFFGHGKLLRTTFWAPDQHHFLAARLFTGDLFCGVFTNLIVISGDDAPHCIGPEPPHPTNKCRIFLWGARITGIHDTACLGLDHGKHAHCHGHFFDVEPPIFVVEEGPRGKLAGQDILVLAQKLLRRHIQGGFILPRKTGHDVFVECAAPHGYLQVLFPDLLTHGLIRIKDGPFNLLRYFSVSDQLLHFVARGCQFVIIADVKPAGSFIQDVLDLIMPYKGLVGIGGNHKAVRNWKPQSIGKLS